MAKLMCITTLKDPDYFKTILLSDIIILSIICLLSIIHIILYLEKILFFFLFGNVFFISLGIYTFLIFKKKKEIQTYENFVFANSRKIWNFLSLMIILFLLIITCYRIFGNLEKKSLTIFFVFYILYFVYLILAIFNFKELKRITSTNFSDKKGNNYLESYNFDEKIEKTENLYVKPFSKKKNKKKHDFEKLKNSKNQKNDDYLVSDGLVFMNNKLPEKKNGSDDSFFEDLENKKIMESDNEKINTDFSLINSPVESKEDLK